jgi:LemA protein
VTAVWIALGLVGVLALWSLVTWNRYVEARQYVAQSWSGVDVELRRRYELIPNLVEVVRAHAAHERATLEAVVAARSRAATANGTHDDEQVAAEAQVSSSLGHLMAVAEGYPQLRADRLFVRLQTQLVDTEDRIAAARRLHNANVRRWNELGQTIPSNLFAGPAGWRPDPYIEFDPAITRTVPPTTF